MLFVFLFCKQVLYFATLLAERNLSDIDRNNKTQAYINIDTHTHHTQRDNEHI